MRYRAIYLLSLLPVLLPTVGIAAEETASAPALPPLYDNLGNHHHPITTKSARAQRYFDQGLRLTFAFNHDEAIAAFNEGARLDPDCAMCYWGAALAMGPNINLPMDPKTEPAAYEAAQKAKKLATTVSEAERATIEALTKRYAAEPGENRSARDRAYADAMREVAKRYPNDADAATLFAEATMDLHPWDYWSADGQPKPGTEEIVATLESVIKKNPNHPGACHYYIHAVEASNEPGRALPCAKRLPKLMPGAGHLVHMPAHTFMRVGMYKEAVEANAHAAHADERYFEGRNVEGFYRLAYYPHNLHFLFAAAAMEGRSADAIKAARDLADNVPNEMVKEIPPLEMFTPTPLFALARFGKWEEILTEPAPPAEFKYTTGVRHYVRGLAFSAMGKQPEAKAELDALNGIASEIPPEMVIGVATPVLGLLKIASNVLSGEMAAKQGDADNAVRRLEEAVQIQDGLPYDEPPPWYEPVRQRLGAVLLAAGRASEAEKIYREDLKRNPNNGWSLYGLKESLRAQREAKQAASVEKQFKGAWKRADVVLTASRF
jgi:tetratricopeptide (TPR) repeat protein